MRKILPLSLVLTLFFSLGALSAQESSPALSNAAGKALNQGKLTEARALAQQCIDKFGAEAKKMQLSIKTQGEKALEGKAEEVFKKYQALNDVGICQFIIGESYRMSKESAQANAAYTKVINEYSESRMLRQVRNVLILEKISDLASSRKKLDPNSKFYNIPIKVQVSATGE